MLDLIKEALDKVKARDVILYDLRGFSPLADYTVIATVDSARQANAIISNLEDMIAESKKDIKIRGIEGRESTWILVDLYDVILHVFTKEERENFALDKLYVNIPSTRWD